MSQSDTERDAGIQISDPEARERSFSKERSFSNLIQFSLLPVTISTVEEGRFLEVNQSFCALTGYARDEVIGRTCRELKLWDDSRQREHAIHALTETGWLRDWEVAYRTRSGAVRCALVSAEAFDLPEQRCVVWQCQDITELKRTQALLDGQARVLALLATDAELTHVLEALVHMIEAQAPGMLASVLLLDNDGQHLYHGAAPSLPPSYCQAVDGLAIGPAAGSCGTAAYRGEPVVVVDIAHDPLWQDYRGLAARYDLRACWSTPICAPGGKAQGKILGTFAMYYRQPRRPTEPDLHLIDVAAYLASIAITRKRMEAALRNSEARFRAFMDNSPAIAFIKDEAGRYVYLNRAIEHICHSPFQELLGKTPYYRLPAEVAAQLVANDRRVLETGEPLEVVEAVPDPTGQVRQWLTVKFPLAGAGGHRFVGGVGVDITQHKLAEQALRGSEERLRQREVALRQLLTHARCILWQATIEGDGGEFQWGPVQVEDEVAAQQILPLAVPPGQSYREAWVASWHPEDVERINHTAVEALRTRQSSYAQEYRCFDHTGQVRWILEDVTLRQTGPGQWSAVGFCTDLTERKGYEQRIAEQALELHEANVKLESLTVTDALTGISNRRGFEAALQHEIQRSVRHCQPLSLLLLDVDDFKAYNDAFGHPAGDEALKAVGQLLHQNARDTDLVSRYGGEEFAVLLPATDQANGLALAERLRAAIEAAPWPDRALTASLGVATMLPDTIKSVAIERAALLAAADRALYRSKQNGRNRITHGSDIVSDSP